ncbi:MAG: 50S ribosomal protein L20 [Patescibacteria group bacterium]
MVRVKRGVAAHKKRERLLKHAKGFMWGRKSKERSAKDALLHAWSHAFRGRKLRKRSARRLWQVKINAGARIEDMSYSKFIALLKKRGVILDRKILSTIAEKHPAVFEHIAKEVHAS